MPVLAQRLAFRGPNGVFQQLTIEFVPDHCDVSRLLGPQDISRPPNFQIPHGDLKSRPQFTELFNRFQSARRLGCQRFPFVQQ